MRKVKPFRSAARPILATLCAGLAAASPLQSVDPDEVRTRVVPYLPKSAFSIRVETKLVEAPVVVRDVHGRPVDRLRRQNFSARE